jgi:hypothetical protein
LLAEIVDLGGGCCRGEERGREHGDAHTAGLPFFVDIHASSRGLQHWPNFRLENRRAREQSHPAGFRGAEGGCACAWFLLLIVPALANQLARGLGSSVLLIFSWLGRRDWSQGRGGGHTYNNILLAQPVVENGYPLLRSGVEAAIL